MTIDEYIIDKLQQEENQINELQFKIYELIKEIEQKNRLLSFIADNINLTNLPNDRYYEFTIWEQDNKGNFDRVDEIKKKYGAGGKND